MITELGMHDIDDIMTFEHAAFPDSLQASRDTYQKRFELGHIMLGYRQDGLQGVISFSYGHFDKDNPWTIPDNFYAWSTQSMIYQGNTAFIYNLGIVPEYRGTRVVRRLVYSAFRRLVWDGCHQVLAEGPVPSYAGNEHVLPNADIYKSLNDYAEGGPVPSSDLLFTDPHLALYRHICPCSIVRVMPAFLPADTASGGFRVMLYRDLASEPLNPNDGGTVIAAKKNKRALFNFKTMDF